MTARSGVYFDTISPAAVSWPQEIDEVRAGWAFYRDRRPETYGSLTDL